MLDLNRTSIDEMLNDNCVTQMISEMLEDGQTVEEYKNDLRSFNAVAVFWKTIFIGYIIHKDTHNPGRKEVHCFFFPDKRCYTIPTLKAIQAYFKNYGFGIYTTVYGTYHYVVLCLTRIGFTVVHTDKDAYLKDGVLYPVFHLTNKY